MTSAALPALRASHGRVINIASGLRALARAALGSPVRDLATTARASSATSSHGSPRALLDKVTTARMRRLARKGHFAETGLAGEYAKRLG